MPLVTIERSRARERKVDQMQGRPDPAGDCSSPIGVDAAGRPDRLLSSLGIESDQSVIVRYGVRCRKCPECLAYRTRLWTAKAVAECVLAPRTWFGTLTVKPERRVFYTYKSELDAKRRASDLSGEPFMRIAASIHPEVTRFLKRVRKNSEARVRYLLVTEAHADGFPHFHMLVHETKYSERVTKRVLEEAWRDGFSQWRLVEVGNTRAAGYVCKYLSKSALTRVRASQRYGRISEYADAFTETVGVLSSAVPMNGNADQCLSNKREQ